MAIPTKGSVLGSGLSPGNTSTGQDCACRECPCPPSVCRTAAANTWQTRAGLKCGSLFRATLAALSFLALPGLSALSASRSGCQFRNDSWDFRAEHVGNIGSLQKLIVQWPRNTWDITNHQGSCCQSSERNSRLLPFIRTHSSLLLSFPRKGKLCLVMEVKS